MKKFISIVLAMLMLSALSVSVCANPILNKYGRVMILTYHKISENPADWGNYCISPSEFEKDLKYLKSEGYTFLKASELKSASIRGKKLAVITFDDGYESDLKYAAPLLEKYNASATFFIFGNALGSKDYLSEKQVTELSKKPFAEIGNHSGKLHTKNYATIASMYHNPKYQQEIIKDFEDNAKLLKKLTGYAPKALSYPNGLYSKSIDEYFKRKDYAVTFSTEEIQFTAWDKARPAGRRNRSIGRQIGEIMK